MNDPLLNFLMTRDRDKVRGEAGPPETYLGADRAKMLRLVEKNRLLSVQISELGEVNRHLRATVRRVSGDNQRLLKLVRKLKG